MTTAADKSQLHTAPARPRTQRRRVDGRVSSRAISALFIALFLGFGGASCSDAFEQTGPSDILLSGKLCIPAQDDCPSTILLHRNNAVGANQLDFRLTNQGEAATFTVTASIEEEDAPDGGLQNEDISFSDTSMASDIGISDTIMLVTRTYALDPGASVNDRFVPRELLTRTSFQLSLDCVGCRGTLDYTLATEALECRNDDECSGTWACSRSDGRCVECLKDSDCSDTQTCDLGTQTCVPPDTSGCAPIPPRGSRPIGLLFGFGLLALGALLYRHNRRRARARAGLVGFLATMLGYLVLGTFSQSAHAAPPSAGVQFGVGPRFLTGKLADDTQRGIGVSVSQEVRGRYIGGRVTLGASYYLTTQTAPPLSHELQLYSVAIGPQFYVPITPIELSFGADIRQVGVVTNSLARLTGPDLNFMAAGGTAQMRYRFSGLAVMIGGGYHPIFGLGSSLVSLNVSIGIATD